VVNKVPLIVSLVAAASALGLSHVYFQRLEDEVSGGAPVTVLVVTEDVPAGGLITDKVLATRDVPSAYIERRQVRAAELQKVVGARVSAGVQANETLLWDDLAQNGDRVRALSGLVETGLRAIGLNGRSADFNGLLRPGDRVDVLFTTAIKDGETGGTMTLLQNLLVLSVGGELGKSSESAPSSRAAGHASDVTLSVTEEQAQLVTQAEERGRLSLTLRNPADIAIADGIPETTGKDVMLAKDRTDWRRPEPAAAKGTVDHVR
jgi:pilus assembly protein CpaB